MNNKDKRKLEAGEERMNNEEGGTGKRGAGDGRMNDEQ